VTASTIFTITVNATDAAGKTGSATAMETVNPPGAPVVTVNAPSPNTANEGQTVTVTWTVSSSGTVTASCINWGDGSSACGLVGTTSATHVYNVGSSASKLFTITVNATNSGGTGSGTNTVTINDLAPTVTVTAPASANEGASVSVSFTATDDEAISRTCVNFGDGSSVCAASPVTHVYSTGGVASKAFTITVNATDAATVVGSNTASITINDIAPTVTVTAPASASEGAGQTVSVAFTATDDEAISKTCISWGDGVSACGITSPATHIYTVSVGTTFTIKVNATDAAGLTGSATASETVNPPGQVPVVTVNAPSPNTANEGQTVTVTWTVSSSATVTASCINWGDGSSACGLVGTTSASHVYNVGSSASMMFTITVNATNSAGTGQGTNAVTVKDLVPVVTITSVSPNPALTGATVTVMFTATDDEAVSACISWGDGTSACGVTSGVTHSYANTGNMLSETFTITVNATDAAGLTSSAMASETVNDRPPIAVIAGPSTATTGQSVTFIGGGSTDPDGTITSYAWNFGDGTTGTGVNATHTYVTTGSFTVTLTVTDNSGNTNSTTHAITVTAPTVHARLAHGKASPAHHHFSLSKDGSTQTFFAIGLDDGQTAVQAYVVFHVTGDAGVDNLTFTHVVTLQPGQLIDGKTNAAFSASFTLTHTGSYSVTAEIFYSGNLSTVCTPTASAPVCTGFTGDIASEKTFSFAVVA